MYIELQFDKFDDNLADAIKGDWSLPVPRGGLLFA